MSGCQGVRVSGFQGVRVLTYEEILAGESGFEELLPSHPGVDSPSETVELLGCSHCTALTGLYTLEDEDY